MKLLEQKYGDFVDFLCVSLWREREWRIFVREEEKVAAEMRKENKKKEGENIGIRGNGGEMGKINEITFIY